MGFYVELHCDTPECPHDGNEQGHQGTHKARIAADAKRHGWRKIDGRWRCPGCVAEAQ
jgi:hypothetical protein